MLTSFVLGATYGFAAAVQPGPLQAYLASEAVTQGWRRTLPAALAPMLSDGPIIVLVLLVLTRLPILAEHLLRCAGGVFVLYLAIRAWRSWRAGVSERQADAHALPRSLLRATLVNLLNPNPYLAWTLVLGPLLLSAWRQRPADGLALLAGFYGTMVLALTVTIAVFARTRSLGPRVASGSIGLSAIALATLGFYQFWTGATALLAPDPGSR